MGLYANLFIGSRDYSWKGFIPDAVCLLFDASEYVAKRFSEDDLFDPDAEEEQCEHSFHTTCGKAQDRLAKQGINLQLLRQLHFAFYAFDLDQYRERLAFSCEGYIAEKCRSAPDRIDLRVERMVRRLLRSLHVLDSDGEFDFLLSKKACSGSERDWMQMMRKMEEEARTRHGAPRPAKGKIDVVKHFRDALRDFLHMNPYDLFMLGDEYMPSSETGAPDLDLIYDLAVPVFASRRTVPVVLEFGEIIEYRSRLTNGEVSGMLTQMQSSLQKRRDFLALAFSQVQTRSFLGSKALPSDLQSGRTPKVKGNAMEDLLASVFGEEPSFGVKQRCRYGDEEIDLVVVNHLDDPFWVAMQSPVILVECRNRRAKLSARDFRDFEIKVANASPLCRLGVMVSAGGFTRECISASKRCSRENYRIILADRNDLKKRLSTPLTTKQWLEDLMVSQL